jgi:hypothetical protein
MEDFFAPLRAQSRDGLLQAIRAHALAEPMKIYGPGTDSSFSQALTRVWNEFVELAGLPAKYRRQVNESVYMLMKRLGVPQAAAELAIKHIPDILDEIGSKTPVPGGGKILRRAAEFVLSKFAAGGSKKP